LLAALVAVTVAPRDVRSDDETVTVFAAASLTRVFTELGPVFQRAHPGQQVRFNFGASSALRSQIQLGAPADVFASADHEQMAPLRKVRLVDAPATFARNRLALVVPLANPARIRSPRDLDQRGLRLVTTAPAVPIGRYTQQALARLAKLPGYPADFVARVNRNVVSREPNVRAVLAKVELGEADAAVVYETDGRASRRVKVLPIPEKANLIAEYPAAVVTATHQRDGAEAFVRFLQSPAARRVLKRYGFR
jgi:molybdate transport system substrate-binding protein